jgi:hypothetical protein
MVLKHGSQGIATAIPTRKWVYLPEWWERLPPGQPSARKGCTFAERMPFAFVRKLGKTEVGYFADR